MKDIILTYERIYTEGYTEGHVCVSTDGICWSRKDMRWPGATGIGTYKLVLLANILEPSSGALLTLCCCSSFSLKIFLSHNIFQK